MKVMWFLLAVLFAWIAALQLNDPDPAYWLVVYSGTALLALSKGIGRFSEFWCAIVIGLVLAGCLIAAPGFLEYLTAGDPGAIFQDMLAASYIEPAREFLGLLIALAALTGMLVSHRQN